MWVYLIIGVCAFSLLQGAIGLAAVLRLLPALLGLARYLTRLLFVGSLRLYRLLLTHVAPLVKRTAGIDLLTGIPRLIAVLLLSTSLWLATLLLLGVGLSAWTIAPAVLHGLIVGLLWDDLAQPGELQMGIKLS